MEFIALMGIMEMAVMVIGVCYGLANIAKAIDRLTAAVQAKRDEFGG